MLEHLHYVMVVVSDMKRSVAFYRDVLGMKLKFESPEWTEFDTGKTTLALHGGGTPAAPAHGSPPAGTASLGLGTLDLDAEVRRLKGLGVRFVMEPQERPGEGIKLAVCVDPDGLGISLSQRLG